MPLSRLLLALLFLQTPKPGSVSGVVTDSVTGAPVRKVQISLHGGTRGYSTITDTTGQFSLPEVDPGMYTAVAERSGYQFRPVPVRVAEGERTGNLALHMTPFGVITGRVLDEDNNPMSQMPVEALVETFDVSGRQLASRSMSMTDDRGEYRIFDIPPGRYYLRVADPRGLSPGEGRLRADQIRTAYVATWFPGVADASQAMPNTLAAGAELSGIDIKMRKMRVYHVRGRVQTSGADQRVDAPIWLTPCDAGGSVPGPSGLYARILRDGAFDASGVLPGAWCLVINQNTDNSHGYYARQNVSVTDHDVNDVILQVLPTAEVHGQVLLDGAPPAEPQPLLIRLEPVRGPGRSVSVNLQPKGIFTLQNVEPGTYHVVVGNPFISYLKSVRFNDQEIADDRVTIPPGGGQMTLLFGTDGGELSGNASAPGLFITATRTGASNGQTAITMSNADGGFLMRRLAPGDYIVLAWETADSGLIQFPAFRKQFETRAVSVTVQSKGRETVSLRPVTAAEIEAAKAGLR